MKKLLFACLLLNSSYAFAQYKGDNVKYKTVYPEDLCSVLQANPDRVIIDVRSPGEFADTSVSTTLNFGHINNAININITDLPSRLAELNNYKNKAVFVYCSHSQRSRRASNLLADSGFTKVFNVNGGLTAFRMQDATSLCPEWMLQTSIDYKLIGPKQLAQNLASGKYFIIDVRTDSAFAGITTDAKRNAMGKLDQAVSIPLDQLKTKLATIPKNKPLVVVDETGLESIKAAQILKGAGFENIFVLFNGLEGWINELPPAQRTGWKPSTNYKLINAYEIEALAKKPNLAIIDVRSVEEFNNSAKDSWRNIGQIKNAINIPFSNLSEQTVARISKNAPILIYSFSSSPDVFAAAQWLGSHGYTDVSVLMGGLFNMRWRAANVKGKESLNQWVVNVPAENG